MIERNKEFKEKSNNVNSLTPEELNRIPYEATEDDFSTYYPNPNRIDKMVREIEKYLRYKKLHSKE